MPTQDLNFGPLRIRAVDPGPYATNCYLVEAPGPDGPDTWIVDAGFGPEVMIDLANDAQTPPTKIILTHAHIDHIAGVADVKAAFPDAPISIHTRESEWLGNPELNLSLFSGMPTTAPGPDETFEDGDTLTLGETTWKVRHVPGHSPGSVALVCAAHNVAIVGDAIFNGSVGRTDFPGCSMETLANSIRTKLYTLAPETVALPGHGPKTTIAHEMASNPFVRG